MVVLLLLVFAKHVTKISLGYPRGQKELIFVGGLFSFHLWDFYDAAHKPRSTYIIFIELELLRTAWDCQFL